MKRQTPTAARPRRTAARLALALAVAVVAGSGCARHATTAANTTPAATTSPPAATLTPEQVRKNVESFDQLWTTVRDNHWDEKLGGVDWDAVKRELRPKVEQATTMDDARAAMHAALDRLGVSHYAILPGELDRDSTAGASSGGATPSTAVTDEGRSDSYAGLKVRLIEGKPYVSAVDLGSPAHAAGIHTGWEVVAVNGKPVAAAVNAVRKALDGHRYADPIAAERVADRFEGRPGKVVTAMFRDESGATVERSLTLAPFRGRIARFGNLPPTPVTFESRRIGPGGEAGYVGYIAFNIWLEPEYVNVGIRKAVAEFADAKGIVIDLRGNVGGLGPMAMGVGGLFVRRNADGTPLKLGTMTMRTAALNFVLIPQTTYYAGKLAVLIDGGSVSTSEIFAGGMRDLGRAKLFGEQTAGAALPSAVERLPNGDALQFVVADYVSAGGARLEGEGVKPDVAVSPTRADLLAGRDPALDAAVSWIHDRPATTPSTATNASR
jgi:carboxyl-terminal processing protease